MAFETKTLGQYNKKVSSYMKKGNDSAMSQAMASAWEMRHAQLDPNSSPETVQLSKRAYSSAKNEALNINNKIIQENQILKNRLNNRK